MPDAPPPPRDPSIVGTIQPGPDEGAEPLFERLPGYKERECEHAAFRLDDKWKTVHCGKCDQPLDPYAVLSQYAEWWEQWEQARNRARSAEKDLHKEALRRLRRLRDCSDEEAAEIDRALEWQPWNRMDVTETRAMVRRIEKSIRERKRAKRKAKREGSDG